MASPSTWVRGIHQVILKVWLPCSTTVRMVSPLISRKRLTSPSLLQIAYPPHSPQILEAWPQGGEALVPPYEQFIRENTGSRHFRKARINGILHDACINVFTTTG